MCVTVGRRKRCINVFERSTIINELYYYTSFWCGVQKNLA